MYLEFTLRCVPTAQQRPRHTRSGMAYKSARQKANERILEAALLPHIPKTPIAGGIELRFIAYLPVPASERRKEELLQGAHTKKPDLDNLAKQLKDAMTRLGFWHDDRQVARLVCEKKYGEFPGWKVALRRICDAG